MDRVEHLADILEALLVRTGWTAGKLARLSHVPKATIDNWLRGRAARPRAWQPIAQVAAAFELDIHETSRLFKIAGHPSVPELLKMHLPTQDRVLLKPWVQQAVHPKAAQPGANITEERTPAHMPINSIAPVAPLPSCSHVYLWRNPFFVGREALLLTIARTLSGHDQAYGQSMGTVVLTGIGGSGKSQAASEWVHRYGQYFAGGVFWISFADPRAIPERIAKAGSHAFSGSFSSYESLPLDEQVRLVWNSWHDAVPRLLIFDGCEDEALLQQWRPANGNTSVIVTSRRSRWNPLLGLCTLPIGVFERHESIALLEHYCSDAADEWADLDTIADIFGDLPLALHLAGAYIDRYQTFLTPAIYLDQLQYIDRQPNQTLLDHPSMIEGTISPTDHEQHLAHTFQQSYRQLDDANATDGLALRIIAYAAVFAPRQRIPRHLLQACVLPANAPIISLYAFEHALMRLGNLGLLENTHHGMLSIHPLIARYVNTTTLIVNARDTVAAVLITDGEDHP